MSLISATNLAKSFGPEDIFAGLSLSIPPRARIALVGANGIGKTTLLRILIGEEPPSGGNVQRARGITMGYLPQEASFEAEHTLWDECMCAFEDLLTQEAQLAALEAQLSAGLDGEDLLARYGKLQSAFEVAGGYAYETRIKQTLSGLGFDEADYEMPLPNLSGGQRTRALLARLLLSEPDLLILDEPTNHLDMAAVEWLEHYLRDWEGAVLLVSHDRYFLDRVVDRIWEMRPTALDEYRGNYTAYARQRVERWEQRKKFVEGEKARMLRELEYIRKNIAGQRTQQAKGKLSRLSRQIRAIEKHGFEGVMGKQWREIGSAGRPMRVEEATQRLGALQEENDGQPSFSLKMRSRQRSGNIILRGRDLQVGYPGKALFSVEEFELRRLECAALIGPNGSGKTSFLRTILNEIEPLAGELRLGASLNVGYLAQAHEDLDPSLTLVEEIERVAPNLLLADIRSYLGRFLFSGDDHFKQVGVLSGGERGRLALAKLALMDANFLLLDEPTTHLDIPSQEVLQEVLAQYDGTIFLVTHDRYLIDALATQVWVIAPEQGALTVYKGTYSDYKEEREAETTERGGQVIPNQEQPEREGPQPVRRSKNEERRLRQRIEEVELLIANLELRLVEIGRAMEGATDAPGNIMALGEEYSYVEKALHEALKEWETLHV